ncbi:uncharacterized protein LOC8259124 isoform X2 [Ricinus communis]|uniref:uncharacterized protein LOC8259124 isoform X2 n=1 Tax=Ricinus communis TaxID=3988 RepID=UPI00201B2B3A|nr:uncharacterized protein LOC8259124 isoform X2 [Ricinus communis]
MQPYSDLASGNVFHPRTQPVTSRQESSSYGQDTAFMQNLALHKAVDSGDWEAAKKFLEDHPDALTASLSADGDTALHVAVLAGHVEIVEELLTLLDAEDLEMKNKNNATALNYAAIGGITRIAEGLVNSRKNLLSIPNQNGLIPVVVASLYGHKDMARYLYKESPKGELSPEKGKNGIMLLTTCIVDDLYDIALDLLQNYPELAYHQDSDKDTALEMLAQKPSAFPSGSTLPLWQSWIYMCIRVPESQPSSNGDIESPRSGRLIRRNIIRRVPGLEYLYNLKLTHVQAHELLCCLCQEISTLHKSEFENIGVYRAIFKAVKHGTVEFVEEMTKHYPDIIWCEDECNRGIFMYAVLQRQEKVFNLIYKMGAKKNSIATSWDKYFNNILHQAASPPPSSQLDRVSGAALQMQRELQWYKEVESIVQPKYKEMVNFQRKTPRALFTESHKKLVEEGEKWMKDTATSSTVVAALIATIMFSAIFTVPGGYDQYGKPLYLYEGVFMVFMVADAMSLFASTSSILMFLGILTARYREEDFLKSLPTKLIVGLSTLFFSIATMMITFGVALFTFLRERVSWVLFPIILLASLPVTLFALLQFPLLVEIFFSTYGLGIFEKSRKWRLF